MSKFSIDINNSHNVNINALLYPTAIYIYPKEAVIINKSAHSLLGLRDNQEFNIDKWKSINPQIGTFLKNIKSNTITDQRMLLTLFNGKKEIIAFNVSIIENGDEKTYIIQFRNATDKYSVCSLSSFHTVEEDIRKLMPYLNNTGKSILKEVLQKHFKDNSSPQIAEDLIYYEREIRIIDQKCPELSHHEIIICGLLLNDMDNNEISTLTKRSLNSIFVAIHRINKKLNVKDRKELVLKLLNIIEAEKESQNNHRVIEDFDI